MRQCDARRALSDGWSGTGTYRVGVRCETRRQPIPGGLCSRVRPREGLATYSDPTGADTAAVLVVEREKRREGVDLEDASLPLRQRGPLLGSMRSRHSGSCPSEGQDGDHS
jgi:hypothetical protein